MLKVLCCEADISVRIRPAGPILIKAGIDEKSPDKAEWRRRFGEDKWDKLPKMIFVRTLRNGRYEPYLPGSSLKGVLRGHAERIARTLIYDEATERIGACDPFEMPEAGSSLHPISSCGAKLVRRRDGQAPARAAEDLSGSAIYRGVCPICKLFGCTLLRGRLQASDAYSNDYTNAETYRGQQGQARAVRLSIRDGVGIDRFTGGAKDTAIFTFEVEERAAFDLFLHLENFELWQLALVAFVLRDVADSLVPIGFGKSRGLGRVTAEATEATITYFGDRAPQTDRIAGVGPLYKGSEDYGFQPNDVVSLADRPAPSADPFGLRHTLKFSGPPALALTGQTPGTLWKAVAPKWKEFAGAWQPEREMKATYLNGAPAGTGASKVA